MRNSIKTFFGKFSSANYKIKDVKRYFFMIFGYSIVGIISLIYGMSKQNLDSNDLFFIELVHGYTNGIYFIFIMQVLFILWFGSIFAQIFFLQDSSNIQFIKRIVKTLIVFSLLFFLFYSFVAKRIDVFLNSVLTSFLFVLPLLYGIVVYGKKKANKEEARFFLVIPAIVVIATNIYAGTCLFYVTRDFVWVNLDVLLYFIPLVVIVLFMTIMHRKNNLIKKIYYIFFSIVLLLFGILGLYFQNINTIISNAFLNVFLAIMTSIFLAVFESWYVYFRIKDDDENSKSKTITPIIKVESWIVSLLPTVVLVLFPFQTFSYLYIISFFIGMEIINIIWFNYILFDYDNVHKMNDDFKKNIPVIRAVLGFVTLLFLYLDQNLFRYLNLTDQIDNFFNSLFSKDPSIFVTVLEIFIGVVLVASFITVLKKIDSLSKYLGNSAKIPAIIRLLSYIIASLVFLMLYAIDKQNYENLNLSIGKLNISLILLSVSILIDLIYFVVLYIKGHISINVE